MVVTGTVPITVTIARVPARTVPLEAIESNVGLMWIQLTPAGSPNELKAIIENSTGGYEGVLISLTT